jgi:hypothetical protein
MILLLVERWGEDVASPSVSLLRARQTRCLDQVADRHRGSIPIVTRAARGTSDSATVHA